MAKNEVKLCKDCYWIHEFPFFEEWYGCLRFNSGEISTKKEKTACKLFENKS